MSSRGMMMMRNQPKMSSTKTTYDDDERPVYKCPYCNKDFTDYSSWCLHKQLHTSTEVFNCELCSYTCRIKKYLARHMKFHRPPTEYMCDVCGKGFHFRGKRDSHMRVHTKEKPFVCTVCGKAFRSSYTLSGHMYTHTDEKPFQCSYCEYACRDSSTLRKHEARHMGVSKLYECKICNKSYKCKWQLKAHLEEKHFGLEAKRYPCQLCDKLFKSKYNVDKHVKTVHEKSLSCECEVCGNVISNKANLAQHMKRHVDVKPYRCTFTNCGRRFKEKGDLRKHVIIHFPEKQHPCGICGRLFARRRRLDRHMATHAPRARAVECHHCGVLFYSKNYLLRHISRKHDRKRNKFICDLCDFTTSNKPSLVMHLKYGHSGKRDRKCQICDKVYKRHEYLKMHYLKSHNIRFKTMLKETEVQPGEIKEEFDDGEEVVEYHPEIDLLEIHKEELVEPEYSDPITYSQTVLSEDISRSIMQRVGRMPGEPESEFDSFFIDHVMEKPDNSVENSDDYCVEGLGDNSRESSVDIDVEKLDRFDMGGLGVKRRENSVDIDVEKFDKFDDKGPGINSIGESYNSGKVLDTFCAKGSRKNSTEKLVDVENFDKNSVKTVKIFVEKLDKNIVEKAMKIDLAKCAEKSVQVTVEKLDINGLYKNSSENISVSNPNKYKNMLEKNNTLKVCVEKLDVNRLKKLRKIGMEKMNKNTVKKIRVKQSDRSYVVNINKNNLGRRMSLKRRRKRGVKPVNNLNMKAKRSGDSTIDPEVTDYSKSVLSEDISRCLQERAGRPPGEPENTLESLFIDHVMEKAVDNRLTSDEESDITAYSKKVLSEDVSRSIMRRDSRVPGEPEGEIDRLFIDHVMERPDKHAIELVKKNIDTQQERYVKKCVDKMLQHIKAQKQAAILEETRKKYNKRIETIAAKANEKEHVTIKYFQNKSTEGENGIIDTRDDENGIIDMRDDENGIIDTRDDKNGIIDTRYDENGDGVEQTPIGDQGIEKTNNKINFNTHQCYICFELFKTKSDLTHHCKDHFQICNYKMLKKCPYCGYVTNLNMKRHLRLKHDVKLDTLTNKITEIKNESGPKYVLETGSCTIEVIPSIKNLNRTAYMKIDETNRINQNNQISTNKLVRKGSEWIVDKDILKVSNEYQLPEFSNEEYSSLNISGDKYDDMLKKLSVLAKKRGLRMLFPCDSCDKVCRRLSGLVLHNRKHETNPKPFKRKVWKDRVVKSKRNVQNSRNIANNRVKVITKVRNTKSYKGFAENCNGRTVKATKTTNVDNSDGVASEITDDVAIDNNISVNISKLADNRFAKPKPIVNKHKCDKELMEFYENNIKGGDIEFWQFLKIFNKMSRENVNDFDDLEARSDFGLHCKDTPAIGNTSSQSNGSNSLDTSNIETSNDNIEECSDTSQTHDTDDNNAGTINLNKSTYKRVIMISKRDRQRRNEIKNELRKRVEGNNVIA